ncbi:MAG: hypothetical protein AB8H79_11360 [Myxococcota bacterium]
MNTVMRVLAACLVVLVLGLVVWSALIEAPDHRLDGRYAVELPPGQTMIFAVEPETTEVLVVSSTLVQNDAPPDSRRAHDYVMEVSWVAVNGDVRRSERVWERSRVSAWPVRGGTWRPSALLQDNGSWASDTRNTRLPVARVLPGGGELHIRAPVDGPPLLLRAFGGAAAEIAAGDLDERARELTAKRLGVADLSSLDPSERALALGRPRRSLAYRLDGGGEPKLRRLVRTQPPITMTQQPTAGSYLLPGQAIGVHVQGPGVFRLSVPDGLELLQVEGRADIPEDLPQPYLLPAPSPALPLAGGAQGARFEITDVTTTLVIRNTSSRVLGPVVTALEGTDPDRLAAETPGVPIQVLAPWSSEKLTLTGPDRVTLPTIAIGPDEIEPYEVNVPLGNPVMRLVIRPDLPDMSDQTIRSVDVDFLNKVGTVLDRIQVAVPVVPAPFERRSEDGGWVGEPLEFDFEVGPDVVRLQVRADAAARVIAKVQGPPRGREDPTRFRPWRLRYWRDSLSPWHRLPPSNVDALREARQIRPVLANIRLEQFHPEAYGTVRRYSMLDPVPRARGMERTWLLPGAAPSGRAWCRHLQGVSSPVSWDRAATRLRNGELTAILHTVSSSSLGQPWRLDLDGRPVAGGRVLQRVEQIRKVGQRPARRIRLQGPPASSVWVAGRDSAACDNPHRSVQAWPLYKGRTLSFPVDVSAPGHRLSLGGFADQPVTLKIELSGLSPRSRERAGSGGSWTETIVLEPGETLGQMLQDPDGRLPALQPVGFKIGAEVQEVRMRVTHVDGPTMWLRALTESDGEPSLVRSGPALLRGVR